MPDDAPPLTWTLTTEQVEFMWKETREVFGNKLWFESMLYADIGLPAEWQDELERRAGADIMDVLIEAVGDLRDPDQSLVFLGLHDTFARYGITLDGTWHPIHGDLLARADALVEAGESRPAYAAATWHLDAGCVARLWDLFDLTRRDEGRIADAWPTVLGPARADELSLRCGEELRIAVYIATNSAGPDVDPAVALTALRDWFAHPYHGQVTLEYAPHPEHGDVLAAGQ
jgi:hypothetical protein